MFNLVGNAQRVIHIHKVVIREPLRSGMTQHDSQLELNQQVSTEIRLNITAFPVINKYRLKLFDNLEFSSLPNLLSQFTSIRMKNEAEIVHGTSFC